MRHFLSSSCHCRRIRYERTVSYNTGNGRSVSLQIADLSHAIITALSLSLIIALSHMINGRSDSHDVLAALSQLMTAALSL
jgi:hypothetical protein